MLGNLRGFRKTGHTSSINYSYTVIPSTGHTYNTRCCVFLGLPLTEPLYRYQSNETFSSGRLLQSCAAKITYQVHLEIHQTVLKAFCPNTFIRIPTLSCSSFFISELITFLIIYGIFCFQFHKFMTGSLAYLMYL